ncbi:hypothetical protein J25TS5_10540 [Paenibacillus faecis]|nr:hypothetical protein J25TS5_10540 [Paenibacillus faecis]
MAIAVLFEKTEFIVGSPLKDAVRDAPWPHLVWIYSFWDKD